MVKKIEAFTPKCVFGYPSTIALFCEMAGKLGFKVQHPQPVEYKGIRLDCRYRINLLVEDTLLIKLKSVDTIKGIHEAQLLTYMKLTDIRTGLLINFNVKKLKDGTKRFVL